MIETIYLRARRDQVLPLLRELPAFAAGKAPDSGPLAYGLALRISTAAMSVVREAFIVKARGGTDEAGEKWQPLSEATIEARQRKAKLPTKRRAARELKAAYAALAKTGRGHKKLAAAKKRADVAFNPEVEILRDTGRMFNSLSPGVSGEVNQGGVVHVRPGEASVGTNVEYARFHHEGTARCPQRRLWPEFDKWPVAWRLTLARAGVTGLAVVLRALLAGRFG